MITKKTKKHNTPAISKHVLFKLLLVVFVPTMVTADTTIKSGNGTFITEKFDCKVARADYAELQRVLEITPRTDFKYKIFLDEYEAITTTLSTHTECEGATDGK